MKKIKRILALLLVIFLIAMVQDGAGTSENMGSIRR